MIQSAAADHLQVVLDHQQRMAGLEQQAEGAQQPRDVLKMQAGGRLVEQQQLVRCRSRAQRRARVPWAAGADGGIRQVPGEFEALRFAARKRRHRLAQAQVVEADVGERLQACEHARRVREEPERLGHGQVEHRGDVGALARRRPRGAP